MSLSVNIQKQLGNFRLNVSFETDGGILGILGASGCGKSYTLKCIAGIERPDSGTITLNEKVLFDSERHINLPPQQREVGYLFQNYALFPNMTVRQNILCGLRHEKDNAKKAAALSEVVERLQLQGLEKHRPHQLSGGQAQRTALARILVSRPKLLMLDEPFSALDTHLRDRLQVDMKELLAKLGTDTLMVTHSRDEAYHLCNRIAVMDHGKLLAVKETKALFADPGNVQASELTGCKNHAPARKTGEYEVEVSDWGICLTTAQPVRDGLEAIGIRAHDFDPAVKDNCFSVTFTGGMEEPFDWILEFRYPNQKPDSKPVWWQIPKDRIPDPKPNQLGVAPESVLLLYQSDI